jgi:epoxyqueuosine reductase
MAVWALGRLLAPDALASLAGEHAPGEPDEAVADEWRAVA